MGVNQEGHENCASDTDCVDKRDVRQRTWRSDRKSWTGELAFQSFSTKITLLGTVRILTKVLEL